MTIALMIASLVFVYSLYRLFLSVNLLELGRNLFRTIVVIVGFSAIDSGDISALTAIVLFFVVSALIVFWIYRK